MNSQLGDISHSAFQDELAADAEDVTTASSSYSHPLPQEEPESRGREFVRRVKMELRSLLKIEGREEEDYSAHLSRVLKQLGRDPKDFAPNF